MRNYTAALRPYKWETSKRGMPNPKIRIPHRLLSQVKEGKKKPRGEHARSVGRNENK